MVKVHIWLHSGASAYVHEEADSARWVENIFLVREGNNLFTYPAHNVLRVACYNS